MLSIDTEMIKEAKILKVICSRCGEVMELSGFFPEPENFPKPIAHFGCKCGGINMMQYIGGKLRSVTDHFV